MLERDFSKTPSFTGSRSVIVNIASVQGILSQAGVPAYAASKGAMLSLTRQVSLAYPVDLLVSLFVVAWVLICLTLRVLCFGADAALCLFMLQMALDYGPHGIRVVAVNPGTVRTAHHSGGVCLARLVCRVLAAC